MFINLKIQTIGKIMSVVLTLCLLILGVQTVIYSVRADVISEFSLDAMPENGVQYSNQIKIILNIAGLHDINMIDLQLPSSTLATLENIEIIDRPGWNTSSPLIVTSTDTLTLFTTSDDYYLDSSQESNIHLAILTFDSAGVYEVLGIESRIHSDSDGWYNIDSVVTYEIVANDIPSIGAITPENDATGVAYNTDITIEVSDGTDNVFDLYITINDGTGAEPIENYFDMSQTSNLVEGGANILLNNPLEGGSYKYPLLEYATTYILDITVTDDQGESVNQIVSFTTQIDNIRPTLANGQDSLAEVTSMSWDDTNQTGAVDIKIEANSDNLPGNMEYYYIFTWEELGYSNVSLGADGMVWASYEGSYDQVLTSIMNGDYLGRLDHTDTDYISGTVVTDFKPASKAMVMFGADNAENLDQTSHPNFTAPILLKKSSDVVSFGYAYPDGVIGLDDATYIYRHSLYPEVCPLPAKDGVNNPSTDLVNDLCR